MDKPTFEHFAESYGSNLKRWPKDIAREAEAALVEHPEWQAILTAEEDIDALLDSAKFTQPNFSDLESSILDQTVNQLPVVDLIINWLRPTHSLWRPALAACLPILIGVTLGTSLELEEQYVLSEEIELLNDSYWIESDTEANLNES